MVNDNQARQLSLVARQRDEWFNATFDDGHLTEAGVEWLRDVLAGAGIVECGWCAGTGVEPKDGTEWRDRACSWCDGDGWRDRHPGAHA